MRIIDRFRRKHTEGESVETRSDSSYTDALVQAIISRESGKSLATPNATAALEACAGLLGRAFSAAEISGPDHAIENLTPDLMNLIGRSLIRKGELVAEIEVLDGRLRYHPCATHDVTGGIDRSAWLYRCHFAGPQKQKTTRRIMAGGVIHAIYAADNETPWRGQGPLTIATMAGRLSAETVTALSDEVSGPRGQLLPIPVDGEDASVQELKGDLKGMAGKLALVESGDWNAPGGGSADWKKQRIGAEPPEALVDQARLASEEIYAACGINPAIFRDTTGTAGREAWRQFLFGLAAPLGGILQNELRVKLDAPDLSITWEELRASDISGRARAFQSLVGGGMEVERAAAVSGVLVDDAA